MGVENKLLTVVLAGVTLALVTASSAGVFDFGQSKTMLTACGKSPNCRSEVAALVQYPLQVVFFHLFERS